MTQTLVDFHCHLDLYPDFEKLVAECEASGVYTLAVTTTPKAWDRNQQLASKTKHVIAALGLHPQVVGSHGHEIDLWESLLPKTRFVGEVGLDAGPRYFRTLDQQKLVFERVLKACNREGGKVLSVHSVRSATIIMDMMDEHLAPGRARIVLHWFSGSESEARRAVRMGCYFSVNAQMTNNARAAKIIARIPNDRLLTETDGPFTQTNGQPSRPMHAMSSLQGIAIVKQQTLASTEDLILANFMQVISDF